jgi:hypothetical protein
VKWLEIIEEEGDGDVMAAHPIEVEVEVEDGVKVILQDRTVKRVGLGEEVDMLMMMTTTTLLSIQQIFYREVCYFYLVFSVSYSLTTCSEL